jgi:hypothetical protein
MSQYMGVFADEMYQWVNAQAVTDRDDGDLKRATWANIN